MVFASMGEEIKSQAVNGPYCFRIHGQIHNSVSPLYPNHADTSGHGQLYIYDYAEAKTKRLEN
jgi:hypothetical protein